MSSKNKLAGKGVGNPRPLAYAEYLLYRVVIISPKTKKGCHKHL
jgi:hypothetical protein